MPMSTSIMVHIDRSDYTYALSNTNHQEGNGVTAVILRDITLFVQDTDAELALEYFERVCSHFRTLLGKPEPTANIVININGTTVTLPNS